MSFLRPIVHVLPAALLGALFVVAAPACTGSLATVLSSSDGGPDTLDGSTPDGAAPGTDGSSPETCVANGGLCVGQSLPPDGYRLATREEGVCAPGSVCYVKAAGPTGPRCVADQDCNGDTNISSLMGACFHGICVCHAPFSVQPNGKCGAAPSPDCILQKNTTCRQTPATCLGDELGGSGAEDSSCGDLVQAICCTKTASCAGPRDGAAAVDFACCSKQAGAHAPICVNGWQTCAGGDSAILKSDTCN